MILHTDGKASIQNSLAYVVAANKLTEIGGS
jgi:hypothetical protein